MAFPNLLVGLESLSGFGAAGLCWRDALSENFLEICD